jgi:hypothetical protein
LSFDIDKQSSLINPIATSIALKADAMTSSQNKSIVTGTVQINIA